MRNYIPVAWKRALSDNFSTEESIGYAMRIEDQKFELLKSGPKSWYGAIILAKRQELRRQNSWASELISAGDDSTIDWEASYSLPYKISRETKLQSFQFRILHRLITCNKYLHTIRLHNDGNCSLCGRPDLISHFFITCPQVSLFWDNLSSWCQTYLQYGLASLTRRERLLGLIEDNGNRSQHKIVNWLLLTAKYYIHRQRLFHGGEVNLLAYLAEAKNRLITEKLACLREGRPNKFKLWEKLLKILNP